MPYQTGSLTLSERIAIDIALESEDVSEVFDDFTNSVADVFDYVFNDLYGRTLTTGGEI
jgi:hypothetical protein